MLRVRPGPVLTPSSRKLPLTLGALSRRPGARPAWCPPGSCPSHSLKDTVGLGWTEAALCVRRWAAGRGPMVSSASGGGEGGGRTGSPEARGKEVTALCREVERWCPAPPAGNGGPGGPRRTFLPSECPRRPRPKWASRAPRRPQGRVRGGAGRPARGQPWQLRCRGASRREEGALSAPVISGEAEAQGYAAQRAEPGREGRGAASSGRRPPPWTPGASGPGPGTAGLCVRVRGRARPFPRTTAGTGLAPLCPLPAHWQ